MTTKNLPVLAAIGLSAISAHAFPIAIPGTEGLSVFVAGPAPINAIYEGNSAGYSNDLYLERDAFGNPAMDGNPANDLFLFNNHASPVGSAVNLGTFAPGTELVFRLYVNNTGNNFYSGPGSRNSDGLPHARVQSNWLPSTTLVSFEDLLGTPEGASGYNDLSFSFSNTRGGVSTPETLSTALWLGVVVAGLGFSARRMRSA